MRQMAFRIKGMCCAEETSQLKRELGPLVGGELNLAFDLLANKMTVVILGDYPSETQIREAVARTGMEAVPWSETCATGICAADEGLWERHGRLITTAISGILMTCGFLLDVHHNGDFLSALLGHGREVAAASGSAISFYLASMVAGAWYVAPRALTSIRRLQPDMNLLMLVAVTGAVAIRQWQEAAAVTFLFALALYLESWSVGRARRAIKALMDISPTTARYVCPHDGAIEERPVEEVPVKAVVLVRPGEKIPLDGIVTKGTTTVNQAPITGESMPVRKEEGDEVFAGTINGDSSIEFRSTRRASDTTLAHIIRMVEDAQSRRAPAEQWVERFARVYTPSMMLSAVAIAVLPPLLFATDWITWFYQALVLLVIACPCSLVISTPVSIVAGITSAARNGVLIKGGAYLEAPGRLRAIAFDKTGTLTYGHPSVQSIIPMNHHSEQDLLANAAALESHSTHPLARAILKLATERDLKFSPAEDFTILPGQGARGSIGNHSYWIGSHRLLEQLDRENPEFHRLAVKVEDAGHSLVIMWCEDHVCGAMSIADGVRPEAAETVRTLKDLGVEKVVMITGDNERTAETVAAVVGVDEWHAELLPEDKVHTLRQLREALGQVAMVGDGVNDAPAMAEASVAIAMGAMGTDAAIETADVALMSDDLAKIPWLISHSRRTVMVIKQNIVFSLGLKVAFVALTLMGHASLWAAIAADMGASLLVIFNGLRLLNIRNQRVGANLLRETQGAIQSIDGKDRAAAA